MDTSPSRSSAVRLLLAPSRIVPALAVAVTLFGVAGFAAYRSIEQLAGAAEWVAHTHDVLGRLQALEAHVQTLQSAQRSFVVTGADADRRALQDASAGIPEELQGLRTFTDAHPAQQTRIAELERLSRVLLENVDQLVRTRDEQGAAVAAALAGSAATTPVAHRVEDLVLRMMAEERRLVEARSEASREIAATTRRMVTVAGSVLMAMLIAGAIALRRDLRARAVAARELHRANTRLEETASAAQQRSAELSRLAEMSQMLQSCQSMDEAHRVIEQAAPTIFGPSGGLYILQGSEDLLDLAASWGPHPPAEHAFGPGDCWALRRGRLHRVAEGSAVPRCAHLSEAGSLRTVCLPLQAQNETIGVMVLTAVGDGSRDTPIAAARQSLVQAAGEHLGLALGNLRLREFLKSQSIRDPLTGLFNRRFLEESIERECRRAARSNRPLSVVMLDLDHFKDVNDTWGHEAGDVVLREIGALLRAQFRGEDVACRYGGEEFALVLVDVPLAAAAARAEHVRRRARELKIEYRRQVMGPITLSLGVAASPDHGTDADVLLRLADRALYRAKAEGRDRVVVADPFESAEVLDSEVRRPRVPPDGPVH